MNIDKEELKSQLDKLLYEGQKLLVDCLKKEKDRRENDGERHIGTIIRDDYQKWYTKSLPAVKFIGPDRYDEFVGEYRSENRKDRGVIGYGIYDFVVGYGIPRGYEFDPFTVFHTRFAQQISILGSLSNKLESAVSEIESVLHSSLLDNELEAAESLLKNGHLRASGAVCGVILESHLGSVFKNHLLKSRKKHTISVLNDALKESKIIDVPQWRHIQRVWVWYGKYKSLI